MKKLSPVLISADLTEPLAFWSERFGFTVTMTLPADPSKDPAGQPIGFAMLDAGGVTVMLQSRASVELDAPGTLGPELGLGGIGLYIEVEDLGPIAKAAEGCEIILPERVAFYGMRELGVRGPGGLNVTFAQRVAQE